MVNSGEGPELSLIVAVKDEEKSIEELYSKLIEVLDGLGKSFEIIFIDDGSSDGSNGIIRNLHQSDPRVKLIAFQRNFGKSAALSAGFSKARGEIVITLDADLQDDPEEIPRLLEKMDEGFDLVSGWKRDRKDPLEKRALSRIFNVVTRVMTGVKIHDFNCGFKCYRSAVTKNLKLHGELYRFIPALAGAQGFSVSEIEVRHHPRKYGTSKYGIERIPRGLFDLLTVLFLSEYAPRPLHLFGGIGAVSFITGFAALLYCTILWFMDKGPIGTRPLFIGAVMLLLLGAQVMSLGLLGELILHISMKADDQYVIKETLD